MTNENYIIRDNHLQKSDIVWEAWTSGDLNKMFKALNIPTNHTDRHFLLMSIVKETYKHRTRDIAMRDLCEKIAWLHLNEFPLMIESLKNGIGHGELPRVSTFQNLATVLTEKGEYQKAIEVCELALSYGLNDGTKGGFQDRIERIKKKYKVNHG